MDTYNNQHEKMATSLLKSLLREVEVRGKSLAPNDFVTKMKLEEATGYLREHYGRNPLNFVQIVKTMLETERHLVDMAEHVSSRQLLPSQLQVYSILDFSFSPQWMRLPRLLKSSQDKMVLCCNSLSFYRKALR